MDTLTHGLAGALLARSLPSTGDEELDVTLARREAWVGFLAAMFPDADVFVSPFSAEFYITQHRALTHSFVMLPVWVVALTALAALRLAPRLGPPGSATRRVALRRLGAVVALGLLSHILMDWITSWGTMFLSPLSWARYTLDWTFIVDLALSGRRGRGRGASLSGSSASAWFRGVRSRDREPRRARASSRRPCTWACARSAMERRSGSRETSGLGPRAGPPFPSRDPRIAGSSSRMTGPP
jgi:membrane-bound metal-dependent hydrolase YbcI (DUF457 family)